MGNAEKIVAKNLLWAAPLAGAIAAVINSILYFIGTSTGLIDSSILIPGANAPLTVVPVIASSIIPSIVAGLVLAGLNYFLSKPWRVFIIIAGVLLVVTFANPFIGIPGISLGMGIWLNVMHVVVAGSVLYCFNRFTRTAN